VSARHEPITGVPALAATPVVSAEWPEVVIEAAAEDGTRVRLRFSPAQAVRIRTADVYVPPGDDAGYRPGAVVEVTDSLWLEELRADAAQLNQTATFMDVARHFFVDAGDTAVEVVAWGLEWSVGEASGRHPDPPPEPGWP